MHSNAILTDIVVIQGISGRKMCAHASENESLVLDTFYHYENIQIGLKSFVKPYILCLYGRILDFRDRKCVLIMISILSK